MILSSQKEPLVPSFFAYMMYTSRIKAVRFSVISRIGYRYWKSLDTQVPINNFVKIHKYSQMYKNNQHEHKILLFY